MKNNLSITERENQIRIYYKFINKKTTCFLMLVLLYVPTLHLTPCICADAYQRISIAQTQLH